MFSYLGFNRRSNRVTDLIHCGQVSKRIRSICHDKSLWQKVYVYDKKVPTEFLNFVLSKGCKDLNLSGSTLCGSLNLKKVSQLIDLQLDYCKAEDGVLEQLLGSCHSLQDLSFSPLQDCHSPLNDLKQTNFLNLVFTQNAKTLRSLNINDYYWLDHPLDFKMIQLIVDNCLKLKEINFVCCNLCEDSINYLKENVLSNVLVHIIDSEELDEQGYMKSESSSYRVLCTKS